MDRLPHFLCNGAPLAFASRTRVGNIIYTEIGTVGQNEFVSSILSCETKKLDELYKSAPYNKHFPFWRERGRGGGGGKESVALLTALSIFSYFSFTHLFAFGSNRLSSGYKLLTAT